MNQIFYADSSVLIKRHVREIGSDWLLDLVTPTANNSIITTTLSIVEVVSALNRRVREAAIRQADYPEIANDFLVISNNEYRFVDFTMPVIAECQRILETYSLRAGDAIQLASAVLARATLQETKLPAPIFLASDNKLLDAVHAEHFVSDSPLLHP